MIKSLIESLYFRHFITALIVINFFVLVHGTNGHETALVENIILFFFTIEVIFKVMVYGWKNFWASSWNKFDFIIVVVGIIPLLGIPLPSGASGLRALRLLRLVGIVPSFRTVIGAIGKSLTQMFAVAGITVFLMAICTLMATMSFQDVMPEFETMFASFSTLLQMTVFGKTELVGIAWGHTKIGTLLVFPMFYLGVPMMTFNLVIGVLSNALTEKDPEINKMKAQLDRIEASLAQK